MVQSKWRKIFPHFESIALLREWGEALGACENFRGAQGASDRHAPYSEGLDRYGTGQFYVKHDAVERVIIIINRVEGKVSRRDVVRRLLPVLGSQLEELGGALAQRPGGGHRLMVAVCVWFIWWFGFRALLSQRGRRGAPA